MLKLPHEISKNILISLGISFTLILLMMTLVFKLLDSKTAGYFFYGAAPLMTGLLGGMLLFSAVGTNKSWSNTFFLSMMVLNLFFVHGLFDSKFFFLVLFPVIIGGFMLRKFIKDVKEIKKENPGQS
jgi:hypothetical protein